MDMELALLHIGTEELKHVTPTIRMNGRISTDIPEKIENARLALSCLFD
jgi:hypothetical protein